MTELDIMRADFLFAYEAWSGIRVELDDLGAQTWSNIQTRQRAWSYYTAARDALEKKMGMRLDGKILAV